MTGSGSCFVCGAFTIFRCHCKECNQDKENWKYFCSRECKIKPSGHPMAKGQQCLASSISERMIIHSTLDMPSGSGVQNPSHTSNKSDDHRGEPEKSLREEDLLDGDKVETSPPAPSPALTRTPSPTLSPTPSPTPSPISAKTACSKRKRIRESKGKKAKRKKKPSEDEVELTSQRKKTRKLSDKFNKVKDRIHKLERLTPSWDWSFEVDKNLYNSRSSKHKYQSAEKASDLPKRNVTDRISRYFKECLTDVKEIEKIDPDYVVTLRALKPESDVSRRKNIHEYVTSVETDDSTPENSQGSHHGSDSSEVLTSQEIDPEGFTLSCRYCRDEIFLQDTRSYVACLKPAGKAHFASHFQCLGLFPTSMSERMDIRNIYKCPIHS